MTPARDKFPVVTKRDRIKGVRDAWFNQYFKDGKWCINSYRNAEKTYHDLGKLDLGTCSEDDVFEVIGNHSWTYLKCDCCQKEVDKVVLVRGFAFDEYGPMELCHLCACMILKAFSK